MLHAQHTRGRATAARAARGAWPMARGNARQCAAVARAARTQRAEALVRKIEMQTKLQTRLCENLQSWFASKPGCNFNFGENIVLDSVKYSFLQCYVFCSRNSHGCMLSMFRNFTLWKIDFRKYILVCDRKPTCAKMHNLVCDANQV